MLRVPKGRFFDGVAEVTTMFSKWRDACVSLLSFADVAIEQLHMRGDAAGAEEMEASKARFLHWLSLLLALAVQRLQAIDLAQHESSEHEGLWNVEYSEQLNFKIREDISTLSQEPMDCNTGMEECVPVEEEQELGDDQQTCYDSHASSESGAQGGPPKVSADERAGVPLQRSASRVSELFAPAFSPALHR